HGSRNKSKRQSAHVDRCHITGDISNHSTADAYQEGLPVGLELDQLSHHGVNCFLHFVFFSGLQHDGIPTVEFLAVQAEHIFIRDQNRLTLVDEFSQFREVCVE